MKAAAAQALSTPSPTSTPTPTTSHPLPSKPAKDDSSQANSGEEGGEGKGKSAPLLSRLGTRLSSCQAELNAKRQRITEDRTRLRSLASLQASHASALASAKVTLRSLRAQLSRAEAKVASESRTLMRLAGEARSVKARLAVSEAEQRAYEDQWREISDLLGRQGHGGQTAKAQPRKAQLTSLAARLEAERRVLEERKAAAVRRMRRRAALADDARRSLSKSSLTPLQRRIRQTSLEDFAVFEEAKEEERLEKTPWSPQTFARLRQWSDSDSPFFASRASRLGPFFTGPLNSSRYANRLDPFVPLCPAALLGTCAQPSLCPEQHPFEFGLTEEESLRDLLSHSVKDDQAVEEAVQRFKDQIEGPKKAMAWLRETGLQESSTEVRRRRRRLLSTNPKADSIQDLDTAKEPRYFLRRLNHPRYFPGKS